MKVGTPNEDRQDDDDDVDEGHGDAEHDEEVIIICNFLKYLPPLLKEILGSFSPI